MWNSKKLKAKQLRDYEIELFELLNECVNNYGQYTLQYCKHCLKDVKTKAHLDEKKLSVDEARLFGKIQFLDAYLELLSERVVR